MNFTTTVQQYDDTQDLYIEIPHYILEQLGWKEGTEIEWHIDENSIEITKVKNTEESGGENQESIIINEGTEKDWEDFWYNSESEGKEYKNNEEIAEHFFQDYDDHYDQYIEETAKETFGQAYHSPEAQGSWN